MKFLIVLSVIALALADEYKVRTTDDLQVFREECGKELNIPAERLEKFKMWDFGDDEVGRCYIRCSFKKFPIFDDKTGPLVDNLVKQLVAGGNKTEDEVRAEVTKCVDEKKADENECSWAFRGFTCFKTANLQLIRASVKKV
uniref:CSON000112 protein n=1 Tax=Culicoides sonorensis TaxID=179676 RepID=A0A336MDT2_CULSO